MTVLRVTPPPAPQVAEDRPKDTQSRPDDLRHAKGPAPSSNAPGRPSQKAARNNLLANSARSGNVSNKRKEEGAGKVWNTGIALACELVQACTAAAAAEGKPAGNALHDLGKMVDGLMMRKPPPSPAELVGHVIHWLRTGESSEHEKKP